MSIRSLLDIVVHVENFRNIDLFFQGLYYLKFTIYFQKNDKKVYAHPYNLTENYKPYPQEMNNLLKNQKFSDNQLYKPGLIQDKSSGFCTKSFFIKFCEEEVELNDICHFRIEIDCSPDSYLTELTMEVDLYFFDCINNNNQEKEKKIEQNQEEDSDKNELLNDSKILSTVKYTIKDSFQGIHEFIPVLFEEQNFCVTNVMFHTTLLDYRFRVCQLQLSEFAQLKPQERLQLIEGNNQNNITGKNSDTISIYDYLQKAYKNISFEGIYKLLVESLKQSYEQLFNHYNFIYSKCILDKQKKTFKKYLQPPMKLIIPEYIANENTKDQQNSLNKDFNQKLMDKFRTKDPQSITHSIMNEANLISGQLFQLWHKYLDLYKISPRFCSAVLQYEYNIRVKDRWEQYIRKNQLLNKNNLAMAMVPNIQEEHRVQGFSIRQGIEKSKKKFTFKIEHQNMFPLAEQAPVIFEDYSLRENNQKFEENISDIDNTTQTDAEQNYYRGIHLFVLVHGFQGNSYDMKLLKNYLNYMHPESMFLCSAINEESTEGDINDMGQKLAGEVQTFVCDNCPGNTLGRISFIGHSLGGIIIRIALTHLQDYQDKFFTYMSLSSPHLGYLYNSSKIIDAGMWILKRWKKSICLQQLTMSENPDLEQTFLYKLSQTKCLGWFKNVCFASSQQDNYAPFESTRVEIVNEANNDKLKGRLYINMAKSIINSLQENASLHRLDVNFHIPENNIDTFIGRTAHILFLECSPLLRMIVNSYENLFN